MKNLRGFIVKFIGPTTFKGSRISIKDTRHKFKVIISCVGGEDSEETAKRFIEERGVPIKYATHESGSSVMMLLSTDFEPLGGAK